MPAENADRRARRFDLKLTVPAVLVVTLLVSAAGCGDDVPDPEPDAAVDAPIDTPPPD